MTSDSPSATADLLRAVADDVSALVEEELRRAQQEMLAKVRQAGRGGALLAGAGALGGLAAGTSAVYVLRVLDRWLPPRTAAFVATGLFAGGAAALASAGTAELREAAPLLPQETLASVRADAAAARSTDS